MNTPAVSLLAYPGGSHLYAQSLNWPRANGIDVMDVPQERSRLSAAI
ncbi:hypothetical protein [Arthrobacter sp. efr-133-R2A-120]|nr:hypothetical protein [Arthrobacter sp. efr-133-R2A-120]